MTASEELHGGCHCRRVRFSVRAELPLSVLDCNCSMCRPTGFLHLIVESGAFTLLSGEGSTTTYRFGTGSAKHLFCSRCGIKSYYVPRSHPDGFSVNARCLDDFGSLELVIEEFDGRNWEENIDSIR